MPRVGTKSPLMIYTVKCGLSRTPPRSSREMARTSPARTAPAMTRPSICSQPWMEGRRAPRMRLEEKKKEEKEEKEAVSSSSRPCKHEAKKKEKEEEKEA